MAYDRDDALLHLTPEGWVRSDERPPGTVETWRYTMTQASGWSREDVHWSCEWADPDVPRERRDEIRARYAERMGRPGRSAYRDTTIGEPL